MSEQRVCVCVLAVKRVCVCVCVAWQQVGGNATPVAKDLGVSHYGYGRKHPELDAKIGGLRPGSAPQDHQWYYAPAMHHDGVGAVWAVLVRRGVPLHHTKTVQDAAQGDVHRHGGQ